MTQQSSDAFRALADATRREILELLRRRPRPVHQIAERFPVSRPAISRHLRLLREAGLVSEKRAGRQRIYEALPEGLEPVGEWLSKLESQEGGASATESAGEEAAATPSPPRRRRVAPRRRSGAERARSPVGARAEPPRESAPTAAGATPRSGRPPAGKTHKAGSSEPRPGEATQASFDEEDWSVW